MCVMESNLIQTPFSLTLEFSQKTALLRSVKHRSITRDSYFRCKSSHCSLQSQKHLHKFQLSNHHQYSSIENAPVIAFLCLGASFYTDSFVLKSKTLIRQKKSHISNNRKSNSCTLYAKQPVVADVGYIVIVFSP